MKFRPLSFALTFLMLFVVTFAFLSLVGATPDTPQPQSQAPENSHTPAVLVDNPEQPVRVVAKDISLDVTVSNPVSTDVDVLDTALEKGAVRYPTSALLGQEGTVLLFGHSSYLPIVYHQYYKTFNGIQNLKTGETVSVYSGTAEYRYTVTGVRLANAEEDVIELTANGRHLTLVTCDSFATKSTRFVVTADFEGAYGL